jgi:DNA-binding response OmpR family regulator
MARAPATTPRRRADEAPAVELTLLSRVAYRDQEITGPRLRGLLALLAGDLRTGCSTARLVEGLWPDEQSEHPTKALQVLVSRAQAQLDAASSPASRARSVPARRCWSWTTASMSCAAPPSWRVRWCR